MIIKKRNVVFGLMGVILIFIMLDFGGLYFLSDYWAVNLPWLTFATKAAAIKDIMHWQILLNISAISVMVGLVTTTLSESEW